MIDLKVRIIEEDHNIWSKSGTEISILFLGKKQEEALLDSFYAIDFIKEILGQTVLDPIAQKGLSLRLRGEFQKLESMQALDDGMTPLKAEELSGSSIPFRLYRIKKFASPGYALTGGYPFVPLSQFLRDEDILPSEIIRHLLFCQSSALSSPRRLSPVQSRSRLHLLKLAKRN